MRTAAATTTTTVRRGVRRCARPALPTVMVVVVVLPLLLAVAVRSDSFDQVYLTLLATVADDFRRHWPRTAAPDGSHVYVRLRPLDGEFVSPSEACGFAVTAADQRGRTTDTLHLPADVAYRCGDRDDVRVSVVTGNATAYEATASLAAGGQLHAVRLATAGKVAVPLADLCFGTVGGSDAFCADVRLLDNCAKLKGNVEYFCSTELKLEAHRPYLIREIVFNDVQVLAREFGKLTSNATDDGARRAVCKLIEFVKTAERELKGCLGRNAVEPASSDGAPDLQFEFNLQGRLVNVNNKELCERHNETSAPSDDGSGVQTQSGARAWKSLHGFLVLSTWFAHLFIFSRGSVAAIDC